LESGNGWTGGGGWTSWSGWTFQTTGLPWNHPLVYYFPNENYIYYQFQNTNDKYILFEWTNWKKMRLVLWLKWDMDTDWKYMGFIEYKVENFYDVANPANFTASVNLGMGPYNNYIWYGSFYNNDWSNKGTQVQIMVDMFYNNNNLSYNVTEYTPTGPTDQYLDKIILCKKMIMDWNVFKTWLLPIIPLNKLWTWGANSGNVLKYDGTNIVWWDVTSGGGNTWFWTLTGEQYPIYTFDSGNTDKR